MSWSRVKSTGSGRLNFRVAIDGWPHEFVTHKKMRGFTSSGTERLVGLRGDGIKISEQVNPLTAEWSADGFRVSIVDIDNRATESFTKRPTAVTYLTTTAETSDNTLTVLNTDLFTDGPIYVNSETMDATVSNSTTFTVTGNRGIWGSLTQKHWTVADGEDQKNPEVTNRPVVLEGRRVRLYVYGGGDDPRGDGNLVFIGVASTGPRYNGSEWSFLVDSLSGILDSDVGGEDSEGVGVGIYYPFTAPLILFIAEFNDDYFNPSLAWTAQAGVVLAGFYATQQSFTDTLQQAIFDAMSDPLDGTFSANTLGSSYTDTPVQVNGNVTGWDITYDTSATPKYLFISGWHDGAMVSRVDGWLDERWIDIPTQTPRATLSASTRYVLRLNGRGSIQEPGSVPRGVFGVNFSDIRPIPDGFRTTGLTGALGGKVYTSVDPSRVTDAVKDVNVSITANGAGGEVNRTYSVRSVDPGGTWLNLSNLSTGLSVFTRANPPQYKLTRGAGEGTFKDFLSSLETDTATYVNKGVTPFIHPGNGDVSADIDIDGSDLADAILAREEIASSRKYSFAEANLQDVTVQECRLLSVFPALNSSGQITFKLLRLPTLSDATSASLSATTIVVEDEYLAWEEYPFGLFNTVVLKTGYNPIEDKHEGRLYKVRNVKAFGRQPRGKTVEIAPFSQDPGPVTKEQAEGIAKTILGGYSEAYQTLTVDVPLSKYDVYLGDLVAISWSKLPDSTGSLGASNLIGLVVGRDWDFMAGKGTLTLWMLQAVRTAGYVPASKITVDSGTTGTTGPFTVSVDSAYFEVGHDAETWWKPGDKIRIFRWLDTTTSGNVTGTVNSVKDDQVTFTADSAWTYGSSTWVIGSQVSTSITADNQKLFCFIAKSDATVDWSGETGNLPFVFGT